MTYSIKYIPAKDLEMIQTVWKELETGEEMTLFQSYDWFKTLLKYYVPNDTKYFESVYAIVESDGQPCMIAPLWIIKRSFKILNRKGVYLIGRFSFSDYLNFVYQHFDPKAFDWLMQDLHHKYGVSQITFENFREDTSIYQYVVNSYHITENKEFPCVTLQLPTSVEEYNKMLSKNSRQNLRTASNRLQKDGLKLVFNDDDLQVDRQQCMKLRESKLSVKYAEFSLLWKYKYRIINRLRFRFTSFNPITRFSTSKVMTVYDGDKNLRAFFCYGYDPNLKAIRVMAAGTDLDFARYSPGMLLMHQFILKAIQEGQLKVIDFTRGDEKYKFALGGKLCLNHRIKLRLS